MLKLSVHVLQSNPKTFSHDSSEKWLIQNKKVDSSHLFAETEGPQERFHIIKLSVAEALQPLRVTWLSGQTHCTDLVGRRERERNKKTQREKWHEISKIERNNLMCEWGGRREGREMLLE